MTLQKKFMVDKGDTNKVLGRAVKFIHERLSELKLSARDTNKAVLMCEESLLRLFRYADFTQNGAFRVNVRKFFGDVLIDLTVPGPEFDFAASIELSDDAKEELSPDAEAAIQNLMLRSFADNVRYKRIRNFNRITVKAYRSNYSGLQLCAVPVVFFSIAVNASDMGNFSGMRRSRTRLLKWFAAVQAIGVLILFALLAGTAAASTGSKFVINAFNELNEIFMKITSYLTKFMPIVIFCSIASMIITTGMNTINAVLGGNDGSADFASRVSS